VADCIGALFEGIPVVRQKMVMSEVNKIETNRQLQKEKGVRPADVYSLQFTDDTAMARSVAASLIDKNGFDAKDMALKFGQAFEAEPDRGYGGNVVTVLEALKNPDIEDVYKPASEQFNGSGSYGNGGAMRVCPVPLFTYFDKDTNVVTNISDAVTRLTHTNPLAIHGAALEAIAVDEALRLSHIDNIDVNKFLDALIAKMKPIEESLNGDDGPPAKKVPAKRELDKDPTPYCAKLDKIKEFAVKDELTAAEVEEVLGNDVSALGSVPAAVLCFVRQITKPEPGWEERSQFERTVLYAITLGGDTDTIATMAAAISGAACGVEQIPESWQYYCEGVADAETYAEKLWQRGGGQ